MSLPTHPMIADVLGDSLFSQLGSIFELMDQAEDEIKRAQRQHPKHAMRLYHAFKLLSAGEFENLPTEQVYSAHCRELLDRVATRADTTLPTNAEVCMAMVHISQRAPLTTEAVLVYMRAFNAVLPGQLSEWDGDSVAHYEHVASETGVAEVTKELHRKLRRPERVIDAVCEGMHHGRKVTCPLQPAEAAA